MWAAKRLRDDAGATLILALIFMGVIALLVAVLGTAATDNLASSVAIKSSRSAEYAAQGAAEAEVQVLRYSGPSYSSTTPCGSQSMNGVTADVYCLSVTPSSGWTRAFTLWACPSWVAPGTCVLTPTVATSVAFNDYSFTGIDSCTSASSATCGIGMQTLSWVVNAGNNQAAGNNSPTVATSSLAAGSQSQSGYSQMLVAWGGTGPYTWAVSSGSLPSGLSLSSSSGVISGNIGASATTSSFTVTAKDANGLTASATLTITITSTPALAISTSSLPAATAGQLYSAPVAASGGQAPYTWSISGAPSWLSISAGGNLSGTPSAGGVSTFSVTVKDSAGATASKSLSITVTGGISIQTTSLPQATRGTAYSQTIQTSGGTAPLTWSYTGTLPAGMSFAGGTLSGTPSASGSFPITVTVTDAKGATASQPLTLTVNAAPAITTTSPLPSATKNMNYNDALAASGGTGTLTWSITAGSLPNPNKLSLSSAGVISGKPNQSAGATTFTVTVRDSNGASASKQFSLTIN